MLNINHEYISTIIQRSRQYHVKEAADVDIDGSNATDDFAPSVLAFNKNDAVYEELHQLIDDLDADQKATLLALMWIGREDYDISEWGVVYKNAQDMLPTISTTSFLAQAQLAEFLEEGLNAYDAFEQEEI